jgi:hypothetical protein
MNDEWSDLIDSLQTWHPEPMMRTTKTDAEQIKTLNAGQFQRCRHVGGGNSSPHDLAETSLDADAEQDFRRTYAIGRCRLGRFPSKAEADYLNGRK